MVGEPLFRMGEDLMGVKLPVDMEAPRGGSALGGHGWASTMRRQRKMVCYTQLVRIQYSLKVSFKKKKGLLQQA